MQLRHDYAEALVALGDLLAQEKNFALAVPTYRDALRLRPDDPSLHVSLAAALRANGDAQGAAAEDQEAVRLNPTNAAYQRDLGNTLYGKGDFKGAAAAYRTSLSLHEDPQTEENLGLALSQLGDWPNAADGFSRRREGPPRVGGSPHESLRRAGSPGRLCGSRRRSASGPAHHSQSSRGAFRLWAMTWVHLGKMDDAIKEYQEALLNKPDYADARLALANALGQQGKLDEAISDYRDYVRERPQEFSGHASLADALLAKKDADGAMHEYEEAIRLRPDNRQRPLQPRLDAGSPGPIRSRPPGV